jgi:hypothetical protein
VNIQEVASILLSLNELLPCLRVNQDSAASVVQ